VAAGFEYRAVVRTEDCPHCFSRPILGYLIHLNDRMDDAERQRLMRFVPRLAGSADEPAVEQERHRHIAWRRSGALSAPLRRRTWDDCIAIVVDALATRQAGRAHRCGADGRANG
jgi:hypothetical protein